jgi:hypothetical protein
MNFAKIALLAFLAWLVSVPLSIWLANLAGPLLFPIPEWRHDDSSIILTFVLMQVLMLGLVLTLSIIAIRTIRANRETA